jgi:hypothetical protein
MLETGFGCTKSALEDIFFAGVFVARGHHHRPSCRPEGAKHHYISRLG